VRLKGDKGFLTIKGPSRDGGLSRFEWEKEIGADEARELLALCEPGLIDKTRWLVKAGTHTFEVDEFHGDNEGLIMAEVELSAPDEPYEKPEWLGQEVTGDRRYYNSYLSKNPYKIWK
jgi:CYTH domain-containing protein